MRPAHDSANHAFAINIPTLNGMLTEDATIRLVDKWIQPKIDWIFRTENPLSFV